MSLGLYVHVPFCRTRCRYCDFYRVGEDPERRSRFLAALEREIDGRGDLHGRTAPTVFLGGGTPSLLAPTQVARLLGHLSRRFPFTADAEVTLEANPSDLDPERLAGYRAAGVNRLSLGIQSFCDRELSLLGRRHDTARALRVVRQAREAGFDNLSLDLMVAIPGQTRASFRRSLETALALAPDHLSAYLLEVHPGSEIDGLLRRRPALFPDAEAQRRSYLLLAERAEDAGLRQYEISNFARPGREGRHNLRYWRRRETLGFGPSAHSLVGERRWRNPPDLAAYLRDPLAVEVTESVPREEELFLGLRLAEGLPVARMAALLGREPEETASLLERLAPWLERRDGAVHLNREGFLLSNEVIAELLREARPPSTVS
ncbi:MAG: radical SAM family heme chaperone HemW [Thermoanaerobaculia bacterium]